MQSRIVVNNKQVAGSPANCFIEGTLLKCVTAPSGYLYAIGQLAYRPKYYATVDKYDYVIQQDKDSALRVYPSDHCFYKEATFVQADKGVSITIEAL